MKIIASADKQELENIKKRAGAGLELAITRVTPVLKDVKTFGDKAVIDYTKKYDSVSISKSTMQLTKQDIENAYKKIDKETITAIKKSKTLVEKYAKLQLPKEWKKQLQKGITIGQLVRPLDSVGCYVPGGNFPLVSTVLMTVVPAKAAGVKDIIVCTPPKQNNEAIIVAADIAGATKIFRVGGSQAVAAMAYGTETIPKVNKIVGPGNIFVTAAKKLVYGEAGIDFIAGPSEIMVFAEKGDKRLIAADLLSQAEHDYLSSAIFITTNKKLAEEVQIEVKKQLKELNSSIASESIDKYGAIIIAKNTDEAFNIINDFAPEHLEIMSDNESLLKKVRNAGAVFFGSFSPEAAGDYAIGNHVLPTAGFAKVRAGLSAMDFVKLQTFQKLSKEGLKSIKGTVTKIAAIEGLKAHKRSVEIRFEKD